MSLGPRVIGRAARALCLVVLLLSPPVAAAPKLQGTAAASLGYTDNFLSAPDVALAGGPRRTQGAFITLSPGVVLAFEAPRYIQRLSYRYEYDLFLAKSNSSGSTNQVDYHGFFELSKRLSLLLGASASETNRYAAVAFSAPGSSTVSGLPAGGGAFAQGEADAALSIDLAPAWRSWQGASVLLESPIFGTTAPRTSELIARAGVERSFFRDAVGLELRPDYTVVQHAVTVTGARAPVQEQLVVNAVALWRHDWGRNFTSSAEAGAARVQRFNTGSGFWTPTGTAMLAFANLSGDAQLSYAHSVSMNPLLGQSLLADEVHLRGGIPLTSDNRLRIVGSAGYQRGRLIDQYANLAARLTLANADVTVAWQATQSLEVTLKYQHIEQVSDARMAPLPLSFVQNNVLAGAIFKWPPDRDMPRPYRAPQRIDRTDEIRDGASSSGELQHQMEPPSQ